MKAATSFIRHVKTTRNIHMQSDYAILYANGAVGFPVESDQEVKPKCDELDMKSKHTHKFNCDDCGIVWTSKVCPN